jgi:DNA repair ATPase RecN
MTCLKIAPVVLATVSLLTFVPDALGQGRTGAPGRGRAAEARPLGPMEVLDMLDAYALVQAQRALELNDTQYGEFVSRLRRLQQVRRGHVQARNRLVNELRQLTRPDLQQIDETTVRDRLRQLREHDARSDADLKKAYDALDEILDLRQQARFRVFEENLERRKLDLLMRARRGAGGDRE